MTDRLPDPGARSAAVVPEASRARLEPWLDACGYRVVVAAAAPQAASVVVADLTAPDGAAALEALRRSAAGGEADLPPVLAIVHEAGPDAARALEELGARDFVSLAALEREGALRLECVRKAARAPAEPVSTATGPSEEAAVFFQCAGDGFIALDEAGRMVAINPAAAQQLGLGHGQALGRFFGEFVTPLSEPLLMEALGTARARGGVGGGGEGGGGLVPPEPADLELLGADEVRRTVSVTGVSTPRRDGWLLTLRDVTAARAAEHELRKAKDFLDKLIESSVTAIVAADLKGRVILYNRGAERLFGYAREEALALNARCFFPEGIAKSIGEQLFAKTGLGRLDATHAEVIIRGGERVPVLLSAALVGEGERATASVAFFNDLREQKQLEDKLSLAEVKLAEAEKRAFIAALAGAAAHELNQPLTSVMGYAELLKRRLTEADPAWRPVDIIYREAERMADIVRKIGKITRDETKAYVGERRILDLDRSTEDE